MAVSYEYIKSPVDIGRLSLEITSDQDITTELLYSNFIEPESLELVFESSLSVNEQTTVSGIVSVHGGVSLPYPATLPTGDIVANYIIVSDGDNSTQWLELDSIVSGTFTRLSDTPTTYSGSKGFLVSVNEDENAVEFTDTLSGINSVYPIEDNNIANKQYVDQFQSNYPRYYINPLLNVSVCAYGQYAIHETGYIEVAGTLEFDEGGMLIIHNV